MRCLVGLLTVLIIVMVAVIGVVLYCLVLWGLLAVLWYSVLCCEVCWQCRVIECCDVGPDGSVMYC